MLRKPRQHSLKPCKCWELRMLRQEMQRIPIPCSSTVSSHDCLVALTARQDIKKTAEVLLCRHTDAFPLRLAPKHRPAPHVLATLHFARVRCSVLIRQTHVIMLTCF